MRLKKSDLDEILDTANAGGVDPAILDKHRKEYLNYVMVVEMALQILDGVEADHLASQFGGLGLELHPLIEKISDLIVQQDNTAERERRVTEREKAVGLIEWAMERRIDKHCTVFTAEIRDLDLVSASSIEEGIVQSVKETGRWNTKS